VTDDQDHRHCKVCGKVVEPEVEFCSKTCRRKREEQNQNRKNLTYLIYASIAFVILITLLGASGLRL
jgi:predicted nucleic acid-binding Zn ribbon protein